MSDQVVGRAELKLKEAVEAFRFDFRGKTVLDIGSSTGGFTELALRKGASQVVAIEIGTNQMKAPLRFDTRVDLYEKTDFFDVIGANEDGKILTKQSENEGELVKRIQVDVVVADVSFVSLRKILRHVKEVVSAKTDYLVMLKPQFEAQPAQLNRGVVKNEKMRREIIKDFESWLRGHGFVVIKKRDNETTGRNGNRERFYWLKGVDKSQSSAES